MDSAIQRLKNRGQVPGVQKVYTCSPFQWISLYSLDSPIRFPNIYPLDMIYPVDSYIQLLNNCTHTLNIQDGFATFPKTFSSERLLISNKQLEQIGRMTFSQFFFGYMYVIVDGHGDHDPWEILFFPTHNNTKVRNSKGVKRLTFSSLVTLGPNEQPIKRKITVNTIKLRYMSTHVFKDDTSMKLFIPL